MAVVHEVQSCVYYSQDIPAAVLQVLVDLDVLRHVQTTVLEGDLHHFYETAAEAHEYRVLDVRMNRSLPLPQDAKEIAPRDPSDPLFGCLEESPS